MKRKYLISISAAALAMTAGVSLVSGAGGGVNTAALRNAVTVEGVRAHQQALQDVADANGGIRTSGTPGFNASLDYVKSKLDAAGYVTSVQSFDFAYFEERSLAEFHQTNPNLVDYVHETDFLTMDYSGSGDVTAVLQGVADNVIPPTETSSSNAGCEAADFAGFVAGNIALIQRGTCTFEQKVANAAAAGAVAAIIFNEGNPGQPDRIPLFGGTLGNPAAIPAISVSFDLGSSLLAQATTTVNIKTDTIAEIRQTANLLAETPRGRPDSVVVVGAHLDSVGTGPGINDNGSGSAGNLEIALQMAALKIKPVNKVRFAWWGAEESGLVGAQHYVDNLTRRARKNIALNLNFDMIGSPNYGRFVYDGNGSDSDTAGPKGSAAIERVFNRYFNRAGLAYLPTAFDGRSDYGPFIDVGIPAGGLFTGAEEIKTAEEAALFGGTEGTAYDPCYHQACDTVDNNSDEGLGQMVDAAAHAVLLFAMINLDEEATAKDAEEEVERVDAKSLPYRAGHLQK